MNDNQELRPIINALLNKVREEQGLTSDEALSRVLDVSILSIYRWRKGYISPSARKLIPLALKFASEIAPKTLDI